MLEATALAGHARDAAAQAGPAFLLVGGLLAIGGVAEQDGVFAWLGDLAGSLPGHGLVLLFGLLGMDCAVTAFLNLDTAVLFMTPVMVHAARRRGVGEAPFVYGSVLMANASSTLLPGANLTNLIVLSDTRLTGADFARGLLWPTAGAIAVTAAIVAVAYRRDLQGGFPGAAPKRRLPRVLGAAACAAVAVIVIATAHPAVPVAAIGAALVVVRRSRIPGLGQLCALFAAAVALGTLARSWGGPGSLMAGAGTWETAAVGAGAAVLVNNLPAAVLLSSHTVAHPESLMLGLAIGPNLAVSGALSALLWLRVARGLGAEASARTYSVLGLACAPAALAVAVALL